MQYVKSVYAQQYQNVVFMLLSSAALIIATVIIVGSATIGFLADYVNLALKK